MKKQIVTFLDFQKMDFRVGQVKKAYFVEGSRNLIAIEVDLGEDYGTVELMAGIGEYYKAEDLVGKKYAFLANLEAKKMMGKYSNGMILAAEFEGRPVVVEVSKDLPNGSVIR